jgi:hypothetical protein
MATNGSIDPLPFTLLGDDQLRHKEENVRLFQQSEEMGNGGTLYVTSR